MRDHFKKYCKPAAAVLVLCLTVVAFAYYFSNHPGTLNSLKHMSTWLLLALLAMYALLTVALVFIMSATLQIINVRMALKENFMLTSYSSIVNFFGPLQSGPGVRLVYLKKKYNVSVRNFAFATFLYYGFFALFSGIFLTIAALQWWQSALVIIAIITGSLYAINRQRKRATLQHFSVEGIVNLALATLAQVLIVATTYFIELHSINPHINFGQALTYTGAANFALFVSLTPGAIGFRESFLLFSRHLHHISSANILTASLVDRAVNVAFLGLLFLAMLGLHVRHRLAVKSPNTSEPKS